jgi:aromatic amino acid aminotransferase I
MYCVKGEDVYDLAVAMNYSYVAGSPELLRFVTDHVAFIHSPPYDDWETCLTSGTTSALDIILPMLCNRGDWILTEEYTYSGALEAAKPLGIKLQGVKVDDTGLVPEDLASVLESWDIDKGGGGREILTRSHQDRIRPVRHRRLTGGERSTS